MLDGLRNLRSDGIFHPAKPYSAPRTELIELAISSGTTYRDGGVEPALFTLTPGKEVLADQCLSQETATLIQTS